MDVFGWVEKAQAELSDRGQYRLAEILDDISHVGVEGERARCEALVAEGLALAKTESNPWLNIFIRHWRLQCNVLTHMDARGMLAEAVDLLETAHREENKDCPQSVCVVQDLAACYEVIDGPGFVDERLAIAKETLERIDATWPCFGCIGHELSQALLDAERFDEVVDFAAEQDRQLLAAGQSRDTDRLPLNRARALGAIGKFDEAEQQLRYAKGEYLGETYQVRVQLLRAWLKASANQGAAALELLPNFVGVRDKAILLPDWIDVATSLALGGLLPNDGELHARLKWAIERFASCDARRHGFMTACRQAELALARGRAELAGPALERAEALRQTLNRDQGAKARLEELRERVEEAITCAASEGVVEDLTALPDDPEERFCVLYRTRLARPADAEILVAFCESANEWVGTGYARETMETFLAEHDATSDLWVTYGSLLLQDGDKDQFLTWLEALPETAIEPRSRLTLEFRLACHLGDDEGQIRILNALLAADPNDVQSHYSLYERLLAAHRERDALSHLQAVMDAYPDNDNLQWDRMVVGTLLDDWVSVRHAAAKLALTLNDSGEGAINLNWGMLRLLTEDANADAPDDYVWARRTGPVTAKVTSISPFDEPLEFGHEFVFDPASLNELDQQDEEGRSVDAHGFDTLLFRRLRRLRHPSYHRFDIDGLHPGEEAVERLMDMLDVCQCEVRKYADSSYAIDVDGEPQVGLYLYVLAPQDADLTEVETVIQTWANDMEKPLVWAGLLEHLGQDPARLETQRALIAEYELDGDRYEPPQI